MNLSTRSGRYITGSIASLVGVFVVVACSADRATDADNRAGALAPGATTLAHSTDVVASAPSSASLASTAPNYFAGPADASRSSVQRTPRVEVSHAESSRPFRELPESAGPSEEVEHEMGMLPSRDRVLPSGVDPVLQSDSPIHTMPATVQNFRGQGGTATPVTALGVPPDTNGAVGPNHYVQMINSGIAIWNKTGTIVAAAKVNNALWTGYVGTNTGNKCATQNDGDPVVVYDQLADRWFITQFSLPNLNRTTGAANPPSFQCVAVSKTGDPTGAYWLYDYKYDAGVNDYGKFGVWPDAYYAAFNLFGPGGFQGAELCAYDRLSMLDGKPAAQQCFPQAATVYSLLPITMDGSVRPPLGTPGFFLEMDLNTMSSLNLRKLHVDWKTPANSTLTGPTAIPVAPFTIGCPNQGSTRNACIPEPGGDTVAALSDRLMFRFSYRNFGTHESLLVNHTVDAGAGTFTGLRWYELRSPNETPVVFQQGTYAPADSHYRWSGSIAQDQSQSFALGFSITTATTDPSIAWTGRLVGDPNGTMGQGETVFATGTGVEQPRPGRAPIQRWGDYSTMTVDPVDDCTFWYTQELYLTSGPLADTQIASLKFPNCGANDFTIVPAPGPQKLAPGGTRTYAVTTTSTKGTAESIVLNIQDLPTGVTGAFAPATVPAGTPSTLTLTATAAAPLTVAPVTFTVIGKAPSAVHAGTAQVQVAPCTPLTTCPNGGTCGSIPDDGCGGVLQCGPACTAPQTCGGGGAPNKCGCTPATTCPTGQGCGTAPDNCGGTVNCASCASNQSCVANQCVAGAGRGPDGGPGPDSFTPAAPSGCGCRTAETSGSPTWPLFGVGGLAAIAALRLRRRSRR